MGNASTKSFVCQQRANISYHIVPHQSFVLTYWHPLTRTSWASLQYCLGLVLDPTGQFDINLSRNGSQFVIYNHMEWRCLQSWCRIVCRTNGLTSDNYM